MAIKLGYSAMDVNNSILAVERYNKFFDYFALGDTFARSMGCIADLKHLPVAAKDVPKERTL